MGLFAFLVIAIFLNSPFVTAGIWEETDLSVGVLANFELDPGYYLEESETVYSLTDTPWGSDQPYINVDCNLFHSPSLPVQISLVDPDLNYTVLDLLVYLEEGITWPTVGKKMHFSS